MMRTPIRQRLKEHIPALALLVALVPAFAWPQASWVGDVIVDGEPSNLWADCLPCDELNEPPNTNWSTDRIPGDDGPLGDPDTGAVIGPEFVVDHNGGTLDLSTLDVQGSLIVGGLINISDSATINNIDLESGGALDGPGPVTLTGTGTWNGVLRSGGGVSNAATLTAATGNLETDLVNSATLVINPSLDFSSTPSTLTNNGSIFLNTDTALNNNSNILDGSGAANLLLNQGTISKSGTHLSVIESPGNHAGGVVDVSVGTLRFFRGDWQFSGGLMLLEGGGRIELTGNVDHVISGTTGILGQGSLLVNMNTFGTLSVTRPFLVDLGGSGEHGLLLQGIGVHLEDALTNVQGGRWSGGTISGNIDGMLINESPLSDPFRIVPGASSRGLQQPFVTTGFVEQSATVRATGPEGAMFVDSQGGLVILAQPESVDWLGDGAIFNSGEVDVRPDARSTMNVDFTQTDGGQLRSEGELRLRGGGSWSGTTLTVLAGQGGSAPVSFENDRFDFVSGTHDFVDLDSTPGVQNLALQDAELIAAADAMVIFNLDEGEEFFGQIDQAGRVVLIGGGLGGAGRFENRGHFHWQSGELGIDRIIEFVNTANGRILISNSGNLLDGRLQNQGEVIGGIRLTSDAVVENSGTWVLLDQVIGASDTSMPGTFENAGVLQVQNVTSGAESRIDARLDNPGTVTVFGGSTLRINGPVTQLQDGTLVGGTWQLGADARLIFPETFQTIGTGTVVRGLDKMDSIEALAHILGGEASVTGDLSLDGGLELNNGARITIDGQSSINVPGGVQNGAPGQNGSITEMLEEALVIDQAPGPPDARMTAFASAGKQAARGAQTPQLTTPLFDNHAVIAPGGLGLPGPCNLDGDLVMHPGSVLAIDIDGPDPVVGHDLLSVTGSAELGGTIEITLAEDFTPTIGQQFVIATAAAGTSGRFSGTHTTNRDDIFWTLTETTNEVILTVADIAVFSDRFEAP